MGLPPDENLPEVIPDSSPQVLTREEAYAQQMRHDQSEKMHVEADDAPKYTPIDPHMKDDDIPASERKADDRKIWGLKRSVFLLLLVVIAIIIVAAAVGGGVGGSMAAKKASADAEAASASSTSSSIPTSTLPSEIAGSAPAVSSTNGPSSSPASSTTSSAPRPSQTFLNNSTGKFEFQAHSEKDFKGESTDILQFTGFTDLPINGSSYAWRPNGSGCCVTLCQGRNTQTDWVGWRCQIFTQPSASKWFNRIFVGCGDEASEENSKCS